MSRVPTKADRRWMTVADELSKLAGERVRLSYRHRPTDQCHTAGVVSTKDYGHTIDVMIDGRGGLSYDAVTKIERMGSSRRYEVVWTQDE